jgi:hypothetical protein
VQVSFLLIFCQVKLSSNFLEVSSSSFSENSCGVCDDDDNDDDAVNLITSFSILGLLVAGGFAGGRWICGLFCLLLGVPELDNGVKGGNGAGGQLHLLVIYTTI